MKTAIGCYYDALDHAQRARILAVRAAQAGRQTRAIRLTAAARRADAVAEDWGKRVPAWQWDAWHDVKD